MDIKIAENKKFIENLFWAKKNSYFPKKAKEKIKKIEIEKKSPNWAKEGILLRYKVHLGDEKIIIRGTSKLNESKKNAWLVMNYLYKNGFAKGKFQVAKPLDYIKEINLLLYKEAKGQTFSEIMANGEREKIFLSIKNIAGWLAAFHSLKTKGMPINNKCRRENNSNVLLAAKSLFPALKQKILTTEKMLALKKKAPFGKTIIHNDFYPNNIIINKNRVLVIDFDKSCIGQYMNDLATITAVFNLPDQLWKINLRQKNKEKAKKIFLEEYASKSGEAKEKIISNIGPYLFDVYLRQLNYYIKFAQKSFPYINKQGKASFGKKVEMILDIIKRQV